PYDSVYLYDKDYRLVATLEKNESADFWSPAIPGDTIHVRFVNALVQQVTMNPMQQNSEAACVDKGATSVERTGDGQYQCMVDSDESGPGSTSVKKYNTFNSEGYRIDRVSYVMDDGQEKQANSGKDSAL